MTENGFGKVGRRARAAVSVGALALALAGGTLPARAQAVYAFDVPRGDLAEVVTRIARTAGTPIVFPAGLAQGRIAGPIRGRESVEAALAQALAGTGLQLARGAGGSFTIRPAAGPVAGVPAGADLAAIDVTDAGGIPGGSHGDQGFQQGDAGDTVRIGDAPAREIPISVTAVTQKVLESQVITTATDALQNVAGVNIAHADSGVGRPNITIRGFNSSGYTVNGMPDGFTQIPIDAVERVEVLKGPSSILNGRDSLGGLVNIGLKQPTDQDIRNVTVRYGSYNYKTIATDLGGRIKGLEGTTYRFVASGNHADQNFAGYRDPHEILVAPSVRWQGQDLTLDAGLRYTQARVTPGTFAFAPQTAAGIYGPIVRPPRGVPIGNSYFGGNVDNVAAFTKQSYDLGRIFGMDITLNNSFQWSYGQADFKVPIYEYTSIANINGPFTIQRFGAGAGTLYITDRFDVTMKYDSEFASQTLKFGYDYLNSNANQTYSPGYFSTNISTGLPYTPRRNVPDTVLFRQSTQSTTEGFYVIDKFDTLDNRLHILGSVRHDNFDQVGQTSYPAFGRTLPKAGISSSGISWVAGAAFDVTPWMTVYGNRSNGYAPNIGFDRSGAVLPPEQRDLAEVGVRYALFDKRLNLTTSFFDLARTNVALTDPADPTGLNKILVPSQNSKGMEIEAQGEVLPGLNLIASLTSQTFDAGKNFSPLSLFGRPKHLASLWATYTLQDSPLAGLTFGAGVRYVGDFQVSPSGTSPVLYRIPGYNTVDAAISYEAADYTVSLKVNNILNQYAFVPSTNSTYLSVIQGRNVTVQATYRF